MTAPNDASASYSASDEDQDQDDASESDAPEKAKKGDKPNPLRKWAEQG